MKYIKVSSTKHVSIPKQHVFVFRELFIAKHLIFCLENVQPAIWFDCKGCTSYILCMTSHNIILASEWNIPLIDSWSFCTC